MGFAPLQEATQRLGAQLSAVTFVLMCAGLIYCAVQAHQEKGVGRVKGHLVRMIVGVILLSAFSMWVTELNEAAMSLIEFDTVANSYESAVLRQFGITTADSQKQSPNCSMKRVNPIVT